MFSIKRLLITFSHTLLIINNDNANSNHLRWKREIGQMVKDLMTVIGYFLPVMIANAADVSA